MRFSAIILLPFLLFLGGVAPAFAQTGSVIKPKVERREIRPPQIEADNIELGAFAGLYSVEDFGVNAVYGIHGYYHLTEDVFVGGSIGASTVTTETLDLFGVGTVITDDSLTYLDILVGYNILPGEVFAESGRAWTSSAYFIGGIGTTKINNDSSFTLVLGGGVRMVPLDWLAIHVGFRDFIYKRTIADLEKTTHNIELTIGASYFF